MSLDLILDDHARHTRTKLPHSIRRRNGAPAAFAICPEFNLHKWRRNIVVVPDHALKIGPFHTTLALQLRQNRQC